jgi:hypothetical protein
MRLGEEIAVLDGIPGGYDAGAQFDPSMGGGTTRGEAPGTPACR